jgi:menaquinone-dependent protoporphyrinogen IX oxidase
MLSGKGIIEVRRILSINSTTRGSTGQIMTQIAKLTREVGYDSHAYGRK